ncbi:MAG TPA: hypothetical protein VFF33_04215 [Ignavibacteriaceae bacterium]|nr:hypothetical protein [Ignavibacteriaceae bacterium]
MNNFYKITLHLILILMLTSGAYAQYKPSKERGDPKYRAKGQMEGNQIRTTIHNFGLTGRQGGGFPISVQTPYEWPKNTGKVYLAMEGLWVGGEVKAENDSTIKVIDVFDFRQSKQGKTWNFEPVPGYYSANKQEIATSVDNTTWPAKWPDKLADKEDPGWPGSWNGFFGKNIFNADQEMFYRASDDKYDRYNYFPDSTDLSRRGIGIQFDMRAMAWSQVLVEDVLYLLHSIRNDGTKDISKVAVAIWYADFVGGDGDSQDDISEFDLIQDIAWSRDRDNRAPTFGNDPVGMIGVSFLETPGNAVDRVDNDGDGEIGGPKVTAEMIVGEDPENGIDDNGNGLIDENQTHIAFDQQIGVTFADRIDQNRNGEQGSPIITQAMIDLAASDRWKRWPINPENDAIQNGQVHILMLDQSDLGLPFSDGIDNGTDASFIRNIETNPVVTQEMITQSSTDLPYRRFKVPGSNIILYDVNTEDLGKPYADGIDNDGDGAIDEGVDERIDEMVDESRNNGIDDDGDWDPLSDDNGLDGVVASGDFGENDGIPTSGKGTNFPGEPNIDVTDVSETDQIGITNAQYVAAGAVNVNSQGDAELWFTFMRPGRFYNPLLVTAGEYDLFVSSGFFPLKSGQTEPISLAVILANGPANDPNGQFRKAEILKKRVKAQETYNNDYQFANAPITPTLTAIPGNNKVTLYWNSAAESSFDTYIANIGGNGNDFEGYRIYRASDPAFEDANIITTGYGINKFKLPMKIFDLVDAYSGFDSIGIEGVHFDLGNNSGLQHSWVDSTVKNGFTYYYAITSYDFGYPAGRIIPSESPIRISIQPDGSVTLGPNVAKVTPEAPAAGYIPATLGQISLVQGSTSSSIGYEIVDINKIQDGHTYNIVFEDTIKPGNILLQKPDTLTTKNYSLIDVTSGDTLLNKISASTFSIEQPIVDGFKLFFFNEDRIEVDYNRSSWNDTTLDGFKLTRVTESTGRLGVERPNDYEIQFGDLGVDTSVTFTFEGMPWPSMPVNFKVFNRTEQRYIDFAFIELDTKNGAGRLSANPELQDRILFLEPDIQNNLQMTWWFYLNGDTTRHKNFPDVGDTAKVLLNKPFLSFDRFSFTASKDKIDETKAKEDLDNVKVVPNPYVASAQWEPKNPYVSGRGPRSLHFIHLPYKCTIRIFTVNGELVRQLEHDSQFSNGREEWDMLSKDNLSVSYGVYIYHIDAPGLGEKIGKFAIIK